VRWRLIGLVAATLLTAAWASGDAATSARVTIRDTSLSPGAVRIDVPGKVTWTNQGTRPHVVTSDGATFQPFVLQPRRSKTLAFRTKRCERYRVDGVINGVVLAGVGASACGAGSGGGGTGGTGGTGGSSSGVQQSTARYQVTVVARLHVVETRSPPNFPDGNGKTDLDLTWTGKWTPLELQFVSGGGTTSFVSSPASQTRGTIRGHLDWSEARKSNGPCSGKIDYAPAKARAALQGSKRPGSQPYVSFDASLVDTGPVDSLTQRKQQAACRTSYPGLPRWLGDSFKVLGVDVHHPPGLSIHPMDTRWTREGGGTTPFPLDRILAHGGFTIDGGVRRATLRQTDYVAKFTGSVKYVFTPVS
jgi:plastocyanin